MLIYQFYSYFGIFSVPFIWSMMVPMGIIAIPILAILTRHQRKMAEIIHGQRNDSVMRSEFEGMQAELSDLRTQLRASNPQTAPVGDAEELKRRLG